MSYLYCKLYLLTENIITLWFTTRRHWKVSNLNDWLRLGFGVWTVSDCIYWAIAIQKLSHRVPLVSLSQLDFTFQLRNKNLAWWCYEFSMLRHGAVIMELYRETFHPKHSAMINTIDIIDRNKELWVVWLGFRDDFSKFQPDFRKSYTVFQFQNTGCLRTQALAPKVKNIIIQSTTS